MASMLNPIRLMLLDDHALILQGISLLLTPHKDMQIVGCFTRSRQLLEALRAKSVDLVVMDYSLSPGEVDGLNLIRGLRLRYPDTRLLVVSAMHTPATVALAMRCGASGFLGKDMSTDEIVVVIRKVAAGQVYLHPAMAIELKHNEVSTRSAVEVSADSWSDQGELTGLSTLSIREREVLRCCLEGLSVTKIAEKFSRSIKTISTQKQSAYKKLGITSDNELFKIRSQFEHG